MGTLKRLGIAWLFVLAVFPLMLLCTWAIALPLPWPWIALPVVLLVSALLGAAWAAWATGQRRVA